MDNAFRFLETDGLQDEEIYLKLAGECPADEAKGYVPMYSFHICLNEGGTQVGVTNLRIGMNENIYYGGNIGYSVLPEYRGHHYAAKACRLLIPLAKRHGMKSLLITCNPDNYPSRRTCELAGATLLRIVDLPENNEMYRDGERQKCQYEMEIENGGC